ncbi:hypothetical protein EW026_g3260 [Hermanssonia centrifuga]|uniref:Isopenicillin N synthase-like Fe(2+) 2OG dioxygenase domain-containing protein n=1 Tax=Hermanssonia centrifuga TaxID=98765 RepID=A0A4S4KLR7_9APHY|nr:hypothetical protein EW026_g3260 [Hermanssonia centrifuga]
MPVAIPELGSYGFVPETQEDLEWADLEWADLEWADLTILDLGLYRTPEGRNQLAQTLIKAVQCVNRQFSIGKQFYDLPIEEKLKYTPEGLEFDGFFKQEHPAIIQDNLGEIKEFARSLHSEVLDPLHVLLAIALELPESYFTDLHKYECKSEDHLRYMKYSKYAPEENLKIGNVWVQGHTDLGSWTLLFRQPVAALQIQNHKTGEWKYVKPQDATLTVNACDALSFLTGGYVRSTIHRVTSPPKDQQHVDRLGLLYFSRPNNDVALNTIKESFVLEREGFKQNSFEECGTQVPTMEEWTFAKQKWQRTKNAVRGDQKYENAQILPGHNARLYA